MRQRLILLLWLFLIVVVGLAWAFSPGQLTVIFTALAAFAALATAIKWPVKPRPPSPEESRETAQRLAGLMRKQLEKEPQRRQVNDPMPIGWRVEARPDASTVSASADVTFSDPLAGLIATFIARPRPVVVVGAPGSGKTVLCARFAHELLLADTSSVPFVLQISSWDAKEKISDWIIGSLLQEYAFLGRKVAEGLITHKLVLPILDGLDEIAENQQAYFLRAVDGSPSVRDAFILTCRTEEFHRANSLRALRGATVVRMLPMEAESVAEYLLEAIAGQELHRWEPVLARLVESPEGPLATTLANPLMLFLMLASYENPGTDPAELLDKGTFDTAERITGRLLDIFVPRMFEPRLPYEQDDANAPAVEWRRDQAERWLTFLASDLRRRGTRNLAWWELHDAVPRPVFVAVGMLLGGFGAGMLSWVMFGVAFGSGTALYGLLFGLGVGMTAGLAYTFIRQEPPRQFRARKLRRQDMTADRLLRDLGFGVVGVLAGIVIIGQGYGHTIGTVSGLVLGLTFSLVRRFTEPAEPLDAVSPDSVLRADRLLVLSACMLGGLVGGLIGGLLTGLYGAPSGFRWPALSAVSTTLLGAGFGLLLTGTGLGLLVMAGSAWGRFVTTRMWLAVRRLTPLRLMTFLRDAQRLGILRQVGPLYQFRHAFLQDHLAEKAPRP
jgi:hypothetical protein